MEKLFFYIIIAWTITDKKFILNRVLLRKTAKRINVDKNAVHLLKLKIMDSLNVRLSSGIESNRIYTSLNLKGTKLGRISRSLKRRITISVSIWDINSHKVCIELAIDENVNIFFK